MNVAYLRKKEKLWWKAAASMLHFCWLCCFESCNSADSQFGINKVISNLMFNNFTHWPYGDQFWQSFFFCLCLKPGYSRMKKTGNTTTTHLCGIKQSDKVSLNTRNSGLKLEHVTNKYNVKRKALKLLPELQKLQKSLLEHDLFRCNSLVNHQQRAVETASALLLLLNLGPS